jgi:hypothetical protein
VCVHVWGGLGGGAGVGGCACACVLQDMLIGGLGLRMVGVGWWGLDTVGRAGLGGGGGGGGEEDDSYLKEEESYSNQKPGSD